MKEKKMDLLFKNLAKGLSLSSLALLLGLAGCTSDFSSSQVVTEETAPSEILKTIATINSDTDPNEIADLFYEIIATTTQDVSGLITLENIEREGIDGLEEGSDTLSSSPRDYHLYTLYYATGEKFYSLEEMDIYTQNNYELLEADSKVVTSVSLLPVNDKMDNLGQDNVSMKIESINTTEDEEESKNFSEISQSLVAYSLYSWLGEQSTIIPLISPSQYHFALTKEKDTYIWTITLQDKEAYNSLYEEAYQAVYETSRKDITGDGTMMADTFETSQVQWILTFDQDGRMKSVDYQDTVDVSYKDTTLELTSKDILQVEISDEEKLSFFTKFFGQIQDKTLKEGDEFVLFPKE